MAPVGGPLILKGGCQVIEGQWKKFHGPEYRIFKEKVKIILKWHDEKVCGF